MACVCPIFYLYFNSRPSARGDCRNGGRSAHGLNFNSRPSARGDCIVAGRSCTKPISIHAPPRGATRSGVHQNRNDTVISIHAPPRGATIPFYEFPRRESYFNSRPSARGDLKTGFWISLYYNFNSRPSARGDDVEYVNYWQIMTISIHAPPRGATSVSISE